MGRDAAILLRMCASSWRPQCHTEAEEAQRPAPLANQRSHDLPLLIPGYRLVVLHTFLLFSYIFIFPFVFFLKTSHADGNVSYYYLALHELFFMDLGILSCWQNNLKMCEM